MELQSTRFKGFIQNLASNTTYHVHILQPGNNTLQDHKVLCIGNQPKLKMDGPYTPQKNSFVKRKHRHLLDIARCLTFQSNIPLVYWGECIQISCYLINRTSSPTIANETSYLRHFGTLPSYHDLRSFGCLCYSKVNSAKTKFEPRAVQGVFLGYSIQSKGYTILNLETNDIFVNRDVISKTPLKKPSINSSQIKPHLIFHTNLLPNFTHALYHRVKNSQPTTSTSSSIGKPQIIFAR